MRKAKAEHTEICIANKSRFIFQVEQRLAQNTRRPKRKWILALSAFILLPMFGSVAGAAIYKWTTTWNTKIHVTNGDATSAAEIGYIPPFWTPDFLNSLPQKSTSIVDLQASRAEAKFLIREPQSVPGWDKVYSDGYLQWKTAPLIYLDVYQNANGQRVAVVQQESNNLNQSQQGIVDYPQNAQLLTNFKPDLTVFLTGLVGNKHPAKTNKANELDIYHKNPNSIVTEFRITGKVSEQTLEMFAKAYLQGQTH